MVGEQALDRLDKQPVHGFRALAVRIDAHALEQAGVVQNGFVGQFHRVLRNSERIEATNASARSCHALDWAACT